MASAIPRHPTAEGAGTGRDIEAALDIQTASAMAPGAKIFLVVLDERSV
jgi:subtilase family serine protease